MELGMFQGTGNLKVCRERCKEKVARIAKRDVQVYNGVAVSIIKASKEFTTLRQAQCSAENTKIFTKGTTLLEQRTGAIFRVLTQRLHTGQHEARLCGR